MTTVTDVSSYSPARLPIGRCFTTPGRHPCDEAEWETRTASIAAEDGKTVFEQQDVEVPKEWSQRATNVVASKYFRGPLIAGTVVHHQRGEIKRERSVRELIDRVVGTITAWGHKDGYFADDDEAEAFEAELAHIILHQKATFNSPVWFNVGVEERPQCSACFILSVEDTMDSILDWCRTEGMIFKGGSGSGVNLSLLRSSREPLSTGGLASGPISFMRGADAIAGSIKSGGKTRRAAKMVILNADHPDIVEFIECKA
ncbi:MAG: vitamin B12-dependent ribonucleotide reductase, partial [Dehalococcoidia bacterium]|nr:vitamin B12-dependent ribonucleotide reductase [Dehalococcoidia bacterium]